MTDTTPITAAGLLAIGPNSNAEPINYKEKLSAIETRLAERRAVRASIRLRSDLEDFQRYVQSVPKRRYSGAATVSSSSTLNLTNVSTAARMTSSEAINTDVETTFTPTNPIWAGLSTANASVSGTYDGSQGTDTLTVEALDTGVHGTNHVDIEVRDSQNNVIDSFRVNRNHAIDTVYSLSNGLELEFGTGLFVDGDTFEIDVAVDVGISPDVDAAFNADPRLESGQGVTAGSFILNDQTINVAADDSISAVLAKINTSNAGVSAAYNITNETIELTQKTTGADHHIDFGADTSGFLTAMKLDSAAESPGTTSEYIAAMSNVPSLSGVTVGDIIVNGTAIAIDPASDSVDDVIERINQTEPGVVVTHSNGRIQLIGPRGEPLSIDSNGTGFFEALKISSDTYTASKRGSQSSVFADGIARRTRNLINDLNRLFRKGDADTEILKSFKSQVDTLISRDLDQNLTKAGARSGVRVATNGTNAYTSVQLNRFARSAFTNLPKVLEIYSGSGAGEGFLQSMIDRIDELMLSGRRPGTLIDLQA